MILSSDRMRLHAVAAACVEVTQWKCVSESSSHQTWKRIAAAAHVCMRLPSDCCLLRFEACLSQHLVLVAASAVRGSGNLLLPPLQAVLLLPLLLLLIQAANMFFLDSAEYFLATGHRTHSAVLSLSF